MWTRSERRSITSSLRSARDERRDGPRAAHADGSGANAEARAALRRRRVRRMAAPARRAHRAGNARGGPRAPLQDGGARHRCRPDRRRRARAWPGGRRPRRPAMDPRRAAPRPERRAARGRVGAARRRDGRRLPCPVRRDGARLRLSRRARRRGGVAISARPRARHASPPGSRVARRGRGARRRRPIRFAPSPSAARRPSATTTAARSCGPRGSTVPAASSFASRRTAFSTTWCAFSSAQCSTSQPGGARSATSRVCSPRRTTATSRLRPHRTRSSSNMCATRRARICIARAATGSRPLAASSPLARPPRVRRPFQPRTRRRAADARSAAPSYISRLTS